MDLLTALPAELLEAIAYSTGAVDRHALLHLRLTCRRIRECADDAFLDSFFTSRWHLYTDHSLRVLYEISRDDRYRRRLSRLTIHFPAAHLSSLQDHARRCHGLGALCKPRVFASTRDGHCLWRDWDKRAHEIEEECSTILEAALMELRAAGIIPKLAAAGYMHRNSLTGVPYGLYTAKRTLRNMSDYSPSFRNRSNDGAVSRILVAIVRADFPVVDLNIRGLNEESPCEPVAFEPMVAARQFPWTSLVKLSTAIHPSNLSPLRKWTPFQDWLASLRSLQTLEIHFMTPDSEYDPDELLSAAKWSRLIQCLEHAPIFSLTLGTGRMPYAGLVRLLSSLRSRLRWLTISNARLVDTEENDVLIWPRAFHWIAHNLELEYVEFYDLSHDETEMATLDDDNKFVARGTPDVVRTLLEHFIKTVKFYDDDAGLLRDERGWLSVAEEEGLGNIPPQHTDADDEEIYGDSFDESDVQLMDDLASPR